MMQYENERIKSGLFYYICIVLVGCILANILLRCDRNLQGFTLAFADSQQLIRVSLKETFLYVLLQRTKQLVVIYLLYKVLPTKYTRVVIVSFLFLFFGFILSCQMYYMGMHGVWYLLLCLFPHYFIYLWMLYFLPFWKIKSEDGNTVAVKICVTLAIFLIAIFLESFVSKIFLKNFLQYMGM